MVKEMRSVTALAGVGAGKHQLGRALREPSGVMKIFLISKGVGYMECRFVRAIVYLNSICFAV